MQTRAYVGIGSNVGERLGFLRAAVEVLCRRGCPVVCASSIYETEPVGYREQGWFLNAVLEVTTSMSAHGFHALLKEVEKEVGRQPSMKWGPREIDLDLLFFGNLCLDKEKLILPHPRLHERRFVLIPLAEVAPDLVHPRLGRSIRELCKHLEDASVVRYAYPPDVLESSWRGKVCLNALYRR